LTYLIYSAYKGASKGQTGWTGRQALMNWRKPFRWRQAGGE